VTDGSSSDGNLPTSDAESDSKGDAAARLFVQPFLGSDNFALRGLGIGIAATYVNVTGTTTSTLLPTYRTPGQQAFFGYRTSSAAGAAPVIDGTIADGDRLRVTPQFYYSVGRYGLLGEYVRVSQDVSRLTAVGLRRASLDHEAWSCNLRYS
jgi:phosphate-selective porin OprO/OprP